MKRLLSVLFLIMISCAAISQNTDFNWNHKTIVAVKDSLPTFNLKQIEVFSQRSIFGFWARWRLNRLIYNVKKVYPYAKTAGELLRKYDKQLENVKSERRRRKIMKQAETQLKEKYGSQLRKLTFTQGLILLKLIDRETDNTSYSLVQGLRGKFVAFFYQGLARLWGYNLKIRYEPKGRDRKIEAIVRLIEEGRL